MRPDEAKRLHDDAALKESFDLLRKRYNKEFENADPSDKDGLYLIRIKFDMIRDFYAELLKILNEESLKKRQ